MKRRSRSALPSRTQRLLLALATHGQQGVAAQTDAESLAALQANDLVAAGPDGKLEITAAGRAHLTRLRAAVDGGLDPFQAQHGEIATGVVEAPEGRVAVRLDQAESPLVWLARRKGRDGQPLITPTQLQAGERLRGEFTRAQLTPRMTANWSAVSRSRHSGGGGAELADVVVAARQRMRRALDEVGPEFSGLLLDVCCFLKRLEDVERERQWPVRSAKLVLQLGLDRLARHYGLDAVARGKPQAPVRTWLAADAEFSVDTV